MAGETMPRRVLITGVSSGLGRALAETYLERGSQVFGLSRRAPEDLGSRDGFRFQSIDLSDLEAVVPAVRELLTGVGELDLVVLNAGRLGRYGELIEADLDDLKKTMDVNMWANKLVLDAVFGAGIRAAQVVAISSGASVNGNRAAGGYSISKAALNMLIKTYAEERPETHFCALAPGLIDTAMQDYICSLPEEVGYPLAETLRSKRGTAEMPTPRDAARRLAPVFARLPGLVDSGSYADVRRLPE